MVKRLEMYSVCHFKTDLRHCNKFTFVFKLYGYFLSITVMLPLFSKLIRCIVRKFPELCLKSNTMQCNLGKSYNVSLEQNNSQPYLANRKYDQHSLVKGNDSIAL